MRTLRTLGDLLTGGDLFHLALLLSLVRVDLQSRLENDYRIRNRVNPISQKVIDDLGDLGRFSLDQDVVAFDRIEIAAYMINTMTDSDQQPFEDLRQLQLPFLDLMSPGHRQEDLDSGVSDVGQLSDTETDGSCSPATPAEGDFRDGVQSPASVVSATSEVWEASLAPLPEEETTSEEDPPTDRLDWSEIETVAQLGSADRPDVGARDAFCYENEDPMDMDFLDDPKAYQPDEEDVENQLIEIDNRLITLDGSIQNLNDGVRHLGEQLATAQTESDVESFLLGAFDPEESGNDLVSGAVGTDADFPIFNTWEMDMDDSLDGMFTSPSDVLAKVDVQVKEEPEDAYEDVEIDQVLSVEIKDEIKYEDEETDDCSFYNNSVKDEDSESGSWSVSGASHLEDHTYAAPTFYEHSKYESSLESFGAAARPLDSPFSPASFQFFHRSRETRDERKARQLGIPFSISDIIDSPMEEFNAMMMQTTLTEEQITLCRDIRRRGKNKVAAQNCRRRKLNLISSLEDEVSRARNYKQQLVAERDELYRLRSEWSEKLRHLEEAVLRGLNKDVEEYSLQLAQDGRGEVRVTQRHSTRVAKLTRA